MVTNDATILKLKHEVLYAVSKAAWEDNLKEKEHDIPYDIIPGPQAQYRCCIYKERDYPPESSSGRGKMSQGQGFRKRGAGYQCGM